jgi:hypothetical protein
MKFVLYAKKQLLYDEQFLRILMQFNLRFMQSRGILETKIKLILQLLV